MQHLGSSKQFLTVIYSIRITLEHQRKRKKSYKVNCPRFHNRLELRFVAKFEIVILQQNYFEKFVYFGIMYACNCQINTYLCLRTFAMLKTSFWMFKHPKKIDLPGDISLTNSLEFCDAVSALSII